MNMIDRIGAILWDTDEVEWNSVSVSESYRNQFREKAVKVLKAMREPTGGMLKADMVLGGYGYNDEAFSADPAEIWQAMIDAALEGK